MIGDEAVEDKGEDLVEDRVHLFWIAPTALQRMALFYPFSFREGQDKAIYVFNSKLLRTDRKSVV